MRHERTYEIIVCGRVGETGPEDITGVYSGFGATAMEAYEHACDQCSITLIDAGKYAIVKEFGPTKPVFVFEILFV